MSDIQNISLVGKALAIPIDDGSTYIVRRVEFRCALKKQHVRGRVNALSACDPKSMRKGR
jgi:hypothetical protein